MKNSFKKIISLLLLVAYIPLIVSFEFAHDHSKANEEIHSHGQEQLEFCNKVCVGEDLNDCVSCFFSAFQFYEIPKTHFFFDLQKEKQNSQFSINSPLYFFIQKSSRSPPFLS